MLMQRCENINKIRLTRTTIQHNGEAGMRDNDLHRQRMQQRTEGLALVGLEKGELFVLRKTVGFALIKADCFALKKVGWFVFKKTVFSPSKRRFLSLWKKRIFRSSNGRMRASRSVSYDSNRRVTNVGSTNLTRSKHSELLYTTIIGRGWEYSDVYFPSWVWIQLQHLNYRCDERSKRRSPLLGGLQFAILHVLLDFPVEVNVFGTSIWDEGKARLIMGLPKLRQVNSFWRNIWDEHREHFGWPLKEGHLDNQYRDMHLGLSSRHGDKHLRQGQHTDHGHWTYCIRNTQAQTVYQGLGS